MSVPPNVQEAINQAVKAATQQQRAVASQRHLTLYLAFLGRAVELQRLVLMLGRRRQKEVRLISLFGPAGVGKTTIIKSLVKHWTKQNIAEAMGPVTVVTGKKRRLSLIECPNDLNAMCDLAKVADLVLLVVDVVAAHDAARYWEHHAHAVYTCRQGSLYVLWQPSGLVPRRRNREVVVEATSSRSPLPQTCRGLALGQRLIASSAAGQI